jgi:hypothetical protein
MNIIGNIFTLYIALTIGAIGGVSFAIARAANPVARCAIRILVAAILTCIEIFAFAYNHLWVWGTIIGFACGLFVMALCIVFGEAEDRMNMGNNIVNGDLNVE